MSNNQTHSSFAFPTKSNRTQDGWKHLEPDQVRGPEGEFVADCSSNVPGRAQRDRANALLIAQAPRLLRLVEHLVLNGGEHATETWLKDAAEAVIAANGW